MNKLVITTLAASLLLFAGSDAAAQPARARVSDTAIRGEANLGSAIIATLKKDERVHVVDLQGDWYRVVVPNEQGTPRTGFVPAHLIEIVSGQETPVFLDEPPILLEEPPMVLQPPSPLPEPPMVLQEPPQFLMGPALRAALPVPQGPPIPPTLAYVMQHRAEAAEHEQTLQALALERDNALAREQELKEEVEALRADPNAVQTRRPTRQIHSDQGRPTAKHSQVREGFWFNGGLGFGSYSCEFCLERVSGGSGGLSLGGTITDRILVGGGSTGYYRSFDDGTSLTVGTVDARVRFYPIRASCFFLTGGLGLGTISAAAPGFLRITEKGVGLVAGLGWDIRVRPNLSLTPFWNGIGVSTINRNAGVGQLGLGITVH